MTLAADAAVARRAAASPRRTQPDASAGAAPPPGYPALVAACLTPICDAIVVATNGGELTNALSVHGITAAVLVVAGLALALG